MIFYCVVAVIVLFEMLPIIVLVVASFGQEGYLAFPPKNYSLRWYNAFFHSTAFLEAFKTSLELSALTTIVSLLLGSVTAYSIDRSPLRNGLTAFFEAPLMMPALVIGLGLLQWFRILDVEIGFLTLFIGQLVITLPYVVRGCLAALYRFNLSLEEAAQTLGCPKIKTFFYITIPILKPSLIASGCFAFISSFGFLSIAIFLSSARTTTLPVRLYTYATYTPDPIIAAISTCSLVLTLIFVIIIERVTDLNQIDRI
jgi:putative spermidine/putrescine transport system permease protein